MTRVLDLRSDHAGIVREILSKHLPAGVFVRAFGSRAKGTAKPWSDLDLALTGPKNHAPWVSSPISRRRSRKATCRFKVDVLDLAGGRAGFSGRGIDRDGVELELAAAGND